MHKVSMILLPLDEQSIMSGQAVAATPANDIRNTANKRYFSRDMAFYHRIPTAYLRWIPAIYFAAIGAADLLSDAWHHQLTLMNALFNALFFVPLVIPHRLVFKTFGILISLAALYCYFAIFVFLVQLINGRHMKYPFDTFVVGPIFVTLFLIGGLSLIEVARRMGRAKEQLMKPTG